MRYFNTTGPCQPERHYMLPAADRLPDADRLFERGSYFVIHAPRQTGKTTTLMALVRQLTEQGRYTALYFSCKPAEAAAGEIRSSQLSILQQIRDSANQSLPEALRPPTWPEAPDLNLLGTGLRAWAHAAPRPLVLFSTRSTLCRASPCVPCWRSYTRAFRTGPATRPGPWSCADCAMSATTGKPPARTPSASVPPARSTSR